MVGLESRPERVESCGHVCSKRSQRHGPSEEARGPGMKP